MIFRKVVVVLCAGEKSSTDGVNIVHVGCLVRVESGTGGGNAADVLVKIAMVAGAIWCC